jgi:hypothetical protein
LIGTGVIVREECSFSVEEAIRPIPTGRARAFVLAVDADLENDSGVGKLGKYWIAGFGDRSELRQREEMIAGVLEMEHP